MKEYIDFCATLQVEQLGKRRLASKLRKYWGVSTIDGVEVFNNMFPLYPAYIWEPERVRKVCNIFGISFKDLKSQSTHGVESKYLFFNPMKQNTASLSKEILATLLETAVPFNEWRTFSITYSDKADPLKFKGWTKEQIFMYVDSHYSTSMIDSAYLTTKGKLDGVDDYVGSYVLLDNGVDFVVEQLDAVVGIASTSTGNHRTSISISFRYKRTGYLDDNSPIVGALFSRLSARTTSVFLDYLGKLGAIRTDAIWYRSYIRTSAASLLKPQDFMKLVYGSVDSGSTQPKPNSSVLTKVIGIVLAVAIIVFTLGTGAEISMAVVAVAFAYATVALTVYSMVMAKAGYGGTAVYIGRWAKVTGLIATVLGIVNVVQNVYKTAAKEAAKSAALAATETAATTALDTATTAVADVGVTIEKVAETISDMVVDKVSGMSALDMASTAAKVVEPLMQNREKNRAEELTSMSAEVQVQQLQLAEMYDKDIHFGIEDIKMYTRPLTADNAMFQVDYLYEGTSTNVLRPSFARYGMNIIS